MQYVNLLSNTNPSLHAFPIPSHPHAHADKSPITGWGRNEVQQCIDGHWVNVDFCQNPRFGVDNGFCKCAPKITSPVLSRGMKADEKTVGTEAPEVACRRPEDPVETVWAPPPSVLGAEPTRSAIEGPDWR